MYVAYASSEEYSEYTGISMYSLLKNNNQNIINEIFLFSNNMSKESKKKISTMCYENNMKLNIIDVDKIIMDIMKKNSLPNFKNGGITVYIQSFPDLIIPEYVDKILLLDSDTIIDNTLEELDKVDMSNKVIGVVENTGALDNISLPEEEEEIVKKRGYYFNAGVLLINMNLWRKYKCTKLCLDSCNKIKKMTFASQTILNDAIPDSYIYLLHPKYNYYAHTYPKYYGKELKKFYSHFGGEIAYEATNYAVIIHYKGTHTRPWFKESTSLLKNKYLDYKIESPWTNTPLLSFYNTSLYKKSSLIEKLKYRIIIPIYQKKLLKYILYLKKRKK